MVKWLCWDWQKGEDAEEGDPAQGALQVGLFYFLALEAERREQGGRKGGPIPVMLGTPFPRNWEAG